MTLSEITFVSEPRIEKLFKVDEDLGVTPRGSSDTRDLESLSKLDGVGSDVTTDRPGTGLSDTSGPGQNGDGRSSTVDDRCGQNTFSVGLFSG